MNICVIGCGYVGLTTAAILANCGYEVRAIEIDKRRLETIQKGHSFFYEPGITELLQATLGKSLMVTDNYQKAVTGSDIIFSCVGTPDNPDGSSNLSYVIAAATEAAPLCQPNAIYVQKSTVPVGTGVQVEQLLHAVNKSVRYVSSPEFLREGTAIGDTLWPDRIVAGSNQLEAAETILQLYRQIENCRDQISKAAGTKKRRQTATTKYLRTSLSSAELIKVTANAFLALKISFANSIAKLADQTNADIAQVMDGVGADRRIGRAFLNAGRGYGGGCFPKDVSGLIRSAEDYGVGMEIMNAASEVNESMPHYIINRVRARIDSFNGKRVAVLGLAFKAGTSDMRRSPAAAIANTLAQQGAHVSAYDPEALEEAKAHLNNSVQLCSSLLEAVADVDYIFIATEWPEFQNVKTAIFGAANLVVDCVNCLPETTTKALGDKYIGVGKSFS